MSPHSTVETGGSDGSDVGETCFQAQTNGRNTGSVRSGRPSNQHKNRSSFVKASDPDSVYDLVCVGFGPASLAIAIALHDALENGTLRNCPKVLFLEKQHRFAWHAGMLLPGAKMQISFIKDLASLRDPRSNFTFLNYLHRQGRLVDFTNLGTFLPARVEYEDYLRWCASFFTDVVQYDREVMSVVRDGLIDGGKAVQTFRVASRDVATGDVLTYRSKNVILALGGQASIPRSLPTGHPKVIHSSQYAHMVPQLLQDSNAPYRVAVVGAGQSAAEIFNNIQTLYPNSKTWLVMRSEFLKPSDDSPFVNSIFNPEYIDSLYPKPTKYRRTLLSDARATNYGVVRLELIEKLYEVMYEQRRELGSDERAWPHRIMGGRRILKSEAHGQGLELHLQYAPVGLYDEDNGSAEPCPATADEIIEADLVIAATGYRRDAHVDMLRDLWQLLPQKQDAQGPGAGLDRWEVQSKEATKVLEVARDYKVQFEDGAVAPGSGVWLQGCCEGTHGLSDTLLSVLATRSGEIVQSVFGSSGDSAN